MIINENKLKVVISVVHAGEACNSMQVSSFLQSVETFIDSHLPSFSMASARL